MRRTFAGEYADFGGDGGPATEALLSLPSSVTAGPDGRIYIADYGNARLRVVGSDGIINTFAGNGTEGDGGNGGPATGGEVEFNGDGGHEIAIGPDGSVYLNDPYSSVSQIRRVIPALPGFSLTNLIIPDEAGTELFIFDSLGRHLQTLDALTRAVRYEFGYDAAGLLVTVIDGNNNSTSIERDPTGNPTAIVGPYGARTALSLDPNDYLASVANPANESVGLTYWPGGLLKTLTDPRQHLHEFTYNDLGLLIHDADPAGGFAHLVRTLLSDGHEMTSTSAMNRVSKYRVEDLPTGEQRRVNTGTDNSETVMVIGTDGLTITTSPDNTRASLLEGPDPRWGMQAPLPKTVTARTPSGLESTITTARAVTLSDPRNPLTLVNQTDTVTVNGRTYTTEYDATTRTFASTSPEGRQDSTVVDAEGRIINESTPGFHPVTISYDPRGRLSAIAQGSGPEARTSTITYNAQGYPETITDSLQRTTSFTYDEAGRIHQQTLPGNRTIVYEYDANGNVTAITPPSKPSHGFAFSSVDEVSDYIPPSVAGSGNTSTSYIYNLDRQPTQILRPDGQTIDFGYDSDTGRLNTITTPRGQTVYAYNNPGCNCSGVGRPSSITTPDGVMTYSYDGDLLTNTAWSGSVVGSVGRAYDDDFRLISVTINGQDPVSFGYDEDSLLTQAGGLTLTRDSENGRVKGTSLGNVDDEWDYNLFGEPAGYTARVSGSPIFSVTYTRDKLGRIETKVETIQGVTNSYVYGYDAAGRLSDMTNNGALISHYEYDLNGNRNFSTISGLTVTYTHDDQDRLLQEAGPSPQVPTVYTYTANGELGTKAVGTDTTTYDYDVQGNLMGVTLPNGPQVEYIVDALNRRIGKKVNGALVQGFLYQDGLKLMAELDGANQVVSRFIYAGKVNVPEYMIKGEATYRILTDHLGSPRLVIDTATGQLAQRMDYDEFGSVLFDTNPGFQPFGFAGGLYDPHNRLVRFGARDYDPNIGRWTARDPIIFGGGDTNLYGYLVQNPIDFIDPFGLRPLTKCEKDALAPYIPKEDLDNADLHDGEVPRWLGKDYAAVTVNNDIYIRPGQYDPSQIGGLALLGHELSHVGQYRRKELTRMKYIWEGIRHGGGLKNKYEKPAYDKEDEIRRGLEDLKKKGGKVGCPKP